jgi:flagellar protein FlaG
MRLQTLDSSTPPLPVENGGIGLSAVGTDVLHTKSVASATPPAPAAPVVAPTQEQLKQAVSQANTSLQKVASSLQFEIDPDTKQTVIRLVDTSDNKVLRQVPSPEVIAIAKAIDKMQGLLIKQVA